MAQGMLGSARRRVFETASVLEEDVQLADAVVPDRRASATRAARALVLRVPAGEWDAGSQAERARGGHGLLVLSGVLVRRVEIGERVGAELLGPGDLLRPVEHDGEEATVPFAATWRVLDTLRLAVLDLRWSVRMSPFPGVGIELTARAMLRSRRLAAMLVISHHPRLEERLQLLLWDLADRYGTVRPDGIHVPVPLTHEMLSELAGARRPSVSGALSRLAEAGLLQRERDGWVLHGEPPAQRPLAPLSPAPRA